MTSYLCPICKASLPPFKRYPRYVCTACADKAQSADGRYLEFSNTSILGGYVARYTDNGADYPSHECYIEGVPCIAGEAGFGGIVIESLS